MKKNILLCGILLSALSTIHADESEIESLLDNISDIATKKSLNVDYLPSIVTVVDGQTFVNAGVQNLSEALEMLPGIQTQLSPMGYTITTVRGLKNPNAYLSDKIKISIDGVVINNEATGSSSFYMDFPLQLVDKIEVLRGPGSTIYGAGAFYGTVNIVTKMGNSHKENQIFLGAGSYQYKTAGANINTSSGDWKIFSDGYYQQNNKALSVVERSDKTNEAMKDFSVSFKATNGGFEFINRLKKNTYGNFYSFEGGLNPIPTKDEDHTNTYFFSQLSYKTNIDDYKLETKANFSHRELDVKANIDGVSSTSDRFNRVGITMLDGFFYYENSKEENLEAEAILTLPKIASHDILVGAGARQVNITHDLFNSSVEDAITKNMTAILANVNYPDFRYRAEKESAFWANPTTRLLNNHARTITYVYGEDFISINPNADLILGLRVDNYSDYGAQLSKRAGFVYRATDKTTFKLLYGSAFRAPTLSEAYQNGHINFRAGDSAIEPEKTDTYEAAAIYSPNFNNKLSLNLFYSKLKNVIDLEEFPDTNPGYQNFKQRYSKGVEFEYFFRTTMEHNLYFNATYIDTQYTIPAEPDIASINQSMPDISKAMLKAMYIYRPTNKLSFGSVLRYYSRTTATKLSWVDTDSTCDPVHIFDETITYRLSPSNEIRLGVKNIFNADIRQPSYYYRVDGGEKREGTSYFLNYTQRF